MEPRGWMPYSQGLSKILILSRTNAIPRIDTYFFKMQYNIVLSSTVSFLYFYVTGGYIFMPSYYTFQIGRRKDWQLKTPGFIEREFPIFWEFSCLFSLLLTVFFVFVLVRVTFNRRNKDFWTHDSFILLDVLFSLFFRFSELKYRKMKSPPPGYLGHSAYTLVTSHVPIVNLYFIIIPTNQFIPRLRYILTTNSMAYGSRRFNAAFTRALQ